MGLDMYLTKKIYVGANYRHNDVSVEIDITAAGKKVNVNPKKITYILEEAGYWRKANAIHAWFVQNVQNGEDECKPHYVSYEQLQELKTLCEQVLKTKDSDKPLQLLPPQDGFFFGSTEVDEGYFQDLKDTIKIIESCDPDADYEYRSSW
jgi:hypothetical protein